MKTCKCGLFLFGEAGFCRKCAAAMKAASRRVPQCSECGGIVARGYQRCMACQFGLTLRARREGRS